MENITVEATESTPGIDFNYTENTFFIRGESYPEDAIRYYKNILDNLETHLSTVKDAEVNFTFELVYFNSSSTLAFGSIFKLLDQASGNGNKVLITWVFEEEDDEMEELGAIFSEDLKFAEFKPEMIKI